MSLSRPRLVLLGILLLIVGVAFYAIQKDLEPRPVVSPPEHQSSLGKTSLEFEKSAPGSQHGSPEAPHSSSAHAVEGLSRPFPETSSVHIEVLQKEITTLEKGMLKRQIAMHSLLKSGLIGDPDPEKADAFVTAADAQGSTDEASALRAKENANRYVEQKAQYLGQKALWNALKEKLRAAELAKKK